MARPAIGSMVMEQRRVGKVVAHRQKGMVDVDFGEDGIIERRPEANLKPYDPLQDAIRIHVLGVYRSLLTKELGIPLENFHTSRGRADVLAIQSGRLTREDIDRLVGRAHAIAIKQEQKPLRVGSRGHLVGGYLEKGTKTPTARGRLRARERQSEAQKHAQDLADYELMLELRRKGKQAARLVANPASARLAAKLSAKQAGKAVPYVGEALMVADAAPVYLDAMGRQFRSAKQAATASWRKLQKGEYRAAAGEAARGVGRSALASLEGGARTLQAALIGAPKRTNGRTPTFKAGEFDPNLWRKTERGLERRGRKHVEATPTRIDWVAPTEDLSGQGFFVLTYDPRFSKSIRRITDMVGHWVYAPQITHRGVQTGVEYRHGKPTAPAQHEVIFFGRGHYGVTGPRANERDVYATKADAEKAAKQLDVKAAAFSAAPTHTVTRGPEGWYVSGPQAGDPEEGTLRSGPFSSESEAEKTALLLDRREANKFAANPIAGFRTSPRIWRLEELVELVELTNELFSESNYPLRNEAEIRTKYKMGGKWEAQVQAQRSAGAERQRPTESVFHDMTYKSIREFLTSEGMDGEQIAQVIEAERANRAAIEQDSRRYDELQRRQVGVIQTERVKRKAVE